MQTTPLIADVQSHSDQRNLEVTKVGVKDLRHPIKIATNTGEPQATVATFNMYVNLPHYVKGTHMSRFVEILNQQQLTIDSQSFPDLVHETCKRLEADNAFIEANFTYFRTKKAPISGVKSLMDYNVTIKGERIDGKVATIISVVVPVTSLCPCSKQISKYGAHNQRSHITITVKAAPGIIWIDDLIKIAESQASAELYGILKRPDEKFVTEKAFENPKFVEDMVRSVAELLLEDKRFDNFAVESENFESIHNHSAYAVISTF